MNLEFKKETPFGPTYHRFVSLNGENVAEFIARTLYRSDWENGSKTEALARAKRIAKVVETIPGSQTLTFETGSIIVTR